MLRLSPMKKFRDAVHGDINVFPHELLVINTRTYQRLHTIRQLDLAYKVYHDAVHTRFEHLLGATHVVDQIWQRLLDRGHLRAWHKEFPPTQTAEIERLQGAGDLQRFRPPDDELEIARHVVRLATLLHDITHIPFGHLLENQLRLFTPHDSGHRAQYFLTSLVIDIAARCSPRRQLVDPFYGHENVSYLLYLLTRASRIITELAYHADVDTTSNPVIPPPLPEQDTTGLSSEFQWAVRQFASATRLTPDEAFQADMIGNTICADLLDYVKRDNYFTGLWDKYDDRIFRSFSLAKVAHGSATDTRVRLALQVIRGTVRHDTISNILRILELRYDLAEKVIFHHARGAASAMLARAFCLAGLQAEDEHRFYSCGDDEALGLTRQLAGQKTGVAGVAPEAVANLIDSLQGRDFYKPYYRFLRGADQASAYGHLQRETVGMKLYRYRDEAIPLLAAIEEAARLPAGSVVLYCPSPKMMLKETEAVVAADSDDGIPDGERLKDFVRNRLPVRGQQVVALEERYAELWGATFFVNPEYRAHSAFLREITTGLLKKRYGYVPAPDPILEEQLRSLPTHDDAEDRLGVLEEIKESVLGELVSAPAAARGKMPVRIDVLERIAQHSIAKARQAPVESASTPGDEPARQNVRQRRAGPKGSESPSIFEAKPPDPQSSSLDRGQMRLDTPPSETSA